MNVLRRLPLISTIVVLIAVGIMVRLGLWQLDRKAEKEALIASYLAAEKVDKFVAWPRNPAEATARLFHHSRVSCVAVTGISSVAGRNRSGDAGLAHHASCLLADGTPAKIVLGWSRDPVQRTWRGGDVSGTIAPGPRLVIDPPLAGLEANALPDPRDIPNNHLSYAVQWFLFAITALVIYGLAVRKRLKG
jgi:surfeit locus 1 family protein